jgi:hypothetical protein
MSIAELMPTIQSLSRIDKERLLQFLSSELAAEHNSTLPLPSNFPPLQDGCPASRQELDACHQEPGIHTLAEIWRSIGAK